MNLLKRYVLSGYDNAKDKCIIDTYQYIWLDLSLKIEKNKFINHSLFALDGILIDFITFVYAGTLIMTGRPINFIFNVVIFFGMKYFSCALVKWPNPVPRLMEYPGVPSLMVTYRRTNDEFPSGHTGYLLLHIWSYRDMGFKWA